MLLSILLDTLDGLLKLLVGFSFNVALVLDLGDLISLGFLVSVFLYFLSLLVGDALVLVTELEQLEHLSSAADLYIGTDHIKFLRWLHLREHKSLGSVVNYELHMDEMTTGSLPCCKRRGTDRDPRTP